MLSIYWQIQQQLFTLPKLSINGNYNVNVGDSGFAGYYGKRRMFLYTSGQSDWLIDCILIHILLEYFSPVH